MTRLSGLAGSWVKDHVVVVAVVVAPVEAEFVAGASPPAWV